MSTKSFFGLFLAALVLLPGCMRAPTYKSKSLQAVGNHCAYRGTKNNVIMQAKLLSREDKRALFGDRSTLIHEDDIQIMYLSVYNLSSMGYVFSPANIDLSIMSYNDVAQLIKTSSVGRFATSIACSVSIVGAVYGSVAFGMLFGLPTLANGVLVFGAMTASMALVFFGKSIKSMVMNKRIKKDITEKTLHKKVIINPGEHYEGIIFVKTSDYKSQFNVTMYEKDENNNLIFDINLSKNE
jgi:hypothetical protein